MARWRCGCTSAAWGRPARAAPARWPRSWPRCATPGATPARSPCETPGGRLRVTVEAGTTILHGPAVLVAHGELAPTAGGSPWPEGAGPSVPVGIAQDRASVVGRSRSRRSGETSSHTGARIVPDGRDEQRPPQPEQLAERPAEQPAERDGAPDQEPDAGVHPAQQPVRADRLAEADLGDVVEHRAVGLPTARPTANSARVAGRQRHEQQRAAPVTSSAHDHHPGLPEPADPPGRRSARPATPADAGRGQHQPDRPGRQVELRSPGRAPATAIMAPPKRFARAGAGGDGAQQPVAAARSAGPRPISARSERPGSRRGYLLAPAMRASAAAESQVARPRRAGRRRPPRPAGPARRRSAGPAALGGGPGRLQLGVALHQALPRPTTEGRYRLVGDVEEHRGHPAQQGDHAAAARTSARRATRPAGSTPNSTNRTRSAAIITGRRRTRSSSAPAGSPTSRNAAVVRRGRAAPSPTGSRPARWRPAAGRASWLTVVPTSLIGLPGPQLEEVAVAPQRRLAVVMPRWLAQLIGKRQSLRRMISGRPLRCPPCSRPLVAPPRHRGRGRRAGLDGPAADHPDDPGGAADERPDRRAARAGPGHDAAPRPQAGRPRVPGGASRPAAGARGAREIPYRATDLSWHLDDAGGDPRRPRPRRCSAPTWTRSPGSVRRAASRPGWSCGSTTADATALGRRAGRRVLERYAAPARGRPTGSPSRCYLSVYPGGNRPDSRWR